MNIKETFFLLVMLIRNYCGTADKCSKLKFQSPIEIPSIPTKFHPRFNSVFEDYFASSFVFKNFKKTYKARFLEVNKRYEYELHFNIRKNALKPAVSGGPFFNSTFYIKKIIFHLELNPNKIGTEHKIQNKKFDGEFQFMTFDSKYRSFEDALKQGPERVAVIVVFIRSSSRFSKRGRLSNFMHLLHQSRSKVHLRPPWTIKRVSPSVFLPVNTESYLMYNGSLSIPTCTENVLWILFRNVVKVNNNLFLNVRKILRTSSRKDVQPLNGRKIYLRSDYILPKVLKEDILYWEPSDYDKLLKAFQPLTGNENSSYCFKSFHCELNPLRWKKEYPECGASLQSPINIKMSQMTPKYMDVFPHFINEKDTWISLPVLIGSKNVYIYYPNGSENWEVVNKINLQKYVLNRIKIIIGSEHSIDDHFYPVEIQFFNVNIKFHNDIIEALKHEDGVFIISKFFEISQVIENTVSSDSQEFKKIIPSLGNAFLYFSGRRLSEDVFVDHPLNVNDLLGTTSLVFVYNGSLSEPPCSRRVFRMIIHNPGFMSPSDFGNIVTKRNYLHIEKREDFTGINEKRPIQDSEGRDVLMLSPFRPEDPPEDQPKDAHLHSKLIEEEEKRIPRFETPMFAFSGTRNICGTQTKFLKINIWVINCISISFAILISK